MFCHNKEDFLFLFAKKMQPEAPALGSGQQKKVGSDSTLKVAAPGDSGSATLVICQLFMYN